jgi:hypothetical protein
MEPDPELDDLAAVARQVMDENRYMVLATAGVVGAGAGRDGSDRPWSAPVFYAHRSYRELFWISSPDVTHSRHLAERPEVGIVIFDSQAAPYEGQPVYMAATVSQLTAADEIAEGLLAYPGPSARGGRSLAPENVTGDSPYRLYLATVTQHWGLCPRESGPCSRHGNPYDHRVELTL